jgi:hypothetical protein
MPEFSSSSRASRRLAGLVLFLLIFASLALVNACGIVLSFVDTRLNLTIYVIVALIWLIPDRRIERSLAE